MPNLLILRIQPEEGISLKFVSKRPGAGMTLRPVSMDFNYGSSFGERSPRLTKRCCWTRLSAMPHYIRARIWWRRVGRPCSRFWITGARRNSRSRIIRRVPGVRRQPMRCWRGVVIHGGEAVTPTPETIKPDQILHELVGTVEQHDEATAGRSPGGKFLGEPARLRHDSEHLRQR